jgi:hypothetical protein
MLAARRLVREERGFTLETATYRDDAVAAATFVGVATSSGAAMAVVERELQQLRDLPPHPNVVSVLDLCEGECEGDVAVVVEPSAVRPIREQLRRWPKVAVQDAVAVVRETALALQHLHAAGVVHGRLTSTSVVVSSSDPLHVKVADAWVAPVLALARGDSESDVAADAAMLAWLAPEALARNASASLDDGGDGEDEGERAPVMTCASDVYMLGGLVLDVLTACQRPPFHWEEPERLAKLRAHSGVNTIDAAVAAGVPMVWAVDVGVDWRGVADVVPRLVALASRCLDSDAVRRPSAADVVAALDGMSGAFPRGGMGRDGGGGVLAPAPPPVATSAGAARVAPRAPSLPTKPRTLGVAVPSPPLPHAATARLSTSFSGEQCGVIATPGVKCSYNGMTVSANGASLLVSDWSGSHSVSVYRLVDGARRLVVGGAHDTGEPRVLFKFPSQVHIAPDGFVFIADFDNRRVQVLAPDLTLHGAIATAGVKNPAGVVADVAVVVVSDYWGHHICVFARRDGALVRRFGTFGVGDGQLYCPRGMCFVRACSSSAPAADDHRVAIADCRNNRVSVFTLAGEFVEHVGVGTLKWPDGVASSAYGELVVADCGNKCVRVFDEGGSLLRTVGTGDFTAVAVLNDRVFAQDWNQRCVVFK